MLLWIPLAVRADAQEEGTSFTVLSYNIHGLFRWIAADDPRDRIPTIGWLASQYDVVGFQEDFEYHHIVKEQFQDSFGMRGNGMGWDSRRVAAKVLLSPVAIFIPHFSPPYGAGISTFVRNLRPPPDAGDGAYRHGFGVAHFGIRVESVERGLEELRRSYVRVLGDIVREESGLTYAYVAAPDGVVIELTQYESGS